MHSNRSCLTFLVAFLAAVFISQSASANDVVGLQPDAHKAGLVNVMGPRGFITQWQRVDAVALAEQVQALRSELIVRKQQLARQVDEKQLDSGDALISVLMPGGLLYAGYRKAAYERVRSDLQEVSEAITEYTRDLAALTGRSTVVTAALR